MATGCNRNEGREERGHLEIGESALALRTFPATAVACKSVSTCITYVPSYCCCMQVCQHLHYVRSQLLLLHASLSALALRTFPATAVACKSVSTCITYVPSYCCCMQVCQHLHYIRSQLLLLHASLSFFLPLPLSCRAC